MRAALLVMAALALLPAAARAQVQPGRHDSTQAQIEAMQGMMGPMMGQMMQSMMEGTLRVLAKPETADQLATFPFVSSAKRRNTSYSARASSAAVGSSRINTCASRM